jgi:phosphoribosylformimino-5-aminoimidazole carboxamide ribotide isomerase
VIAAGGVAGMDDIKALYPLARDNAIEGVIVGRAIYEKSLDIGEAVRWIEEQQAATGGPRGGSRP